MEDLFPIVFLIIGIVTSVMSSKKQKEQREKQNARRAAAAKPPVKPAPPARPAAPAPKAEQLSMGSVLPPREGDNRPVEERVIKPQVHVHYDPDCDTHDASGSLNAASTEGKDDCHEEQLSSMRTAPVEDAGEAPAGLALQWSANELVRAVVMQEVLTRPSQRRRS